MAKLRVVYSEEWNSFAYLERSEANRVIEILKLLPSLSEWTPAAKITYHLGQRLPAVLSTLHKLAGAECVDIQVQGRRKVIAHRPVLLLNKEEYNPHVGEKRFLRAMVRVRKPTNSEMLR